MVGHMKKERITFKAICEVVSGRVLPGKLTSLQKTFAGAECILGPMVKFPLFLMPIQVENWNAPGGVFFAS